MEGAMLVTFPDGTGQIEDAGALKSRRWIDLIDPTPDEIARIEAAFEVEIPSRESLVEIEASSRLRAHDGTLYLSAPLIAGTEEDQWQLAPTGLILNGSWLITIRFARLPVFETVHKRIAGDDCTAPQILIFILEELVDRAADYLERAAEMLTETSARIFVDESKKTKLGVETRRLRQAMVLLGRITDRMTRVRHSFITLGRIATFVADRCEPRLDLSLRERLRAVRDDITSLDEFEASLANRVQFMLDAAAGFISIAQNDVVKVLTVVSVAGVPPVLIVGIYGMNFRYMPELAWPWGYPFALALVVISTILPVAWFKWRDWL
jgi:magnesium transporter